MKILLGFLLGLVAQFLLNHRKASEAAITEHISDIVTLRLVSTGYWLSDPASEGYEEAIEACKVHVALAAVTEFEAIATRWLTPSEVRDYQNSINSLVNIVTTADFHSPQRILRPEVAIDISRECASLILFLRGARSTLYSPMPHVRFVISYLRLAAERSGLMTRKPPGSDY